MSFFCMEIVVQVLCPTAQITDAHCSSNSFAVNLTKTFDLDSTGERSQCISRKIQCCWEETDCNQDQCFCQNRNLSPVKQISSLSPDNFSKSDSKCKGEYREKVFQCVLEVSLREMYSKEKHVSSLCIGKYFSTLHIRVSIHESTGKCKDCSKPDRFRNLKFVFHRYHLIFVCSTYCHD